MEIYLKGRQMGSSTKSYETDEVKRAQSVVRSEMRVKRTEIERWIGEMKLQAWNDLEILSQYYDDLIDSFGKRFRKTTKRFCGKGDFYSRRELLKQIHASKLKEKTKNAMIKFIEESSMHRRAGNLIGRWREEKSNEKIHKFYAKIRKGFEKIGCSFVAIPDLWGIDHLVNPFSGIERILLQYNS